MVAVAVVIVGGSTWEDMIGVCGRDLGNKICPCVSGLLYKKSFSYLRLVYNCCYTQGRPSTLAAVI